MINWMMLNFQDSNCYIMTLMTYFHDFIMIILLAILILIVYIILWFGSNKLMDFNIMHNHLMETIWTLIPMLVLFSIAIPSLNLLYLIEETHYSSVNIKILGHQWYWSYEYLDLLSADFDSFMAPVSSLMKGEFRLLEVDNHVVIPQGLDVRALVSSADVIHSWAMPSLGVKVDAVPGRVNQFSMNLERMGLFYGQCSEICGVNHSYMPIVLESTGMKNFKNWLKTF